MLRSVSWIAVTVVAALAGEVLAQTVAHAPGEEVDITTPTGQRINFAVSGGGEYQFKTDIDDGGDFSLFRFAAGLGMQRAFTDDFRASVHLSYGLDWYDFSPGAMGLEGGAEPWSDIHTVTLYGLLSYDFTTDWTIFGGPIIQSSREAGADFGDSITAGGTIGVTYRWTRDLRIGGGLIITTELERDARVRPFVVIDYQIDPRWQLRSTTGGTLVNRTGIELIHQFGRDWELALGGASQYSRFRLDDDGPTAGGVGQDDSLPMWFRATYRYTQQLSVDAVFGLNLFGRLRLRDADGAHIAASDYDMAPFLGLFASYRF